MASTARSARLQMTLAAIVVAVAGAGVLIVMWLALPWPTDKRTWPDFRSGSFGDAVLLPLTTAALVGLRRSLPGSGRRAVGAVAGVAGAVVGFAVQVSWALDPEPPPTWAFTRAHVLSSAGWWHGAFFVVMSGVVAWLATDFVVRAVAARRADPNALRNGVVLGLLGSVVAAGGAFAGLVALDSAPSAASVSSSSSLVALVLAGVVTCGLLGWAMGRVTVGLVLAVGAGLLAAAAVVLLLADWPPSALRLASACAVTALAALPLRRVGHT